MSTATDTASELQALQRLRSISIKSRIMDANRLQAIVAGTIGYSSGLSEKERMKKFTEATAVIESVEDGTADSPLKPIILATLHGIRQLERTQKEFEKEMLAASKSLPVADWVMQPDQRGFGLLQLAIVIGECGDLSNYANPGKVWRRMGCAPWSHDGKTQMGATWRGGKGGKLPSEQWELYGYSPRRRSIAYMIGEGLVKQNMKPRSDTDIESDSVNVPRHSYIYRARYDQAKAKIAELHPGYSPKRCHMHGMLLATKLLLRNLWRQWNGGEDDGGFDCLSAQPSH